MTEEEAIIIKNETNYRLSDRERRHVTILLVEPDTRLRVTIRQALVSLGYEDITDASDSVHAIEKIESRRFTHVLFDSKDRSMHSREFLTILLRKIEGVIAIPISNDPTIDEVFDLLISGARGYVAKPCTAGSLEEAIVWASKGESISDAILHASSRNEALAMLVLSAQSKLALITKQARTFATAKREVPRRWETLRRSIEIAKTFTKGGSDQLANAIVAAAIKKVSSKKQKSQQKSRRRRRR